MLFRLYFGGFICVINVQTLKFEIVNCLEDKSIVPLGK